MIDNDYIRRLTPEQFEAHRRALFFSQNDTPLPDHLAASLEAAGLRVSDYQRNKEQQQ